MSRRDYLFYSDATVNDLIHQREGEMLAEVDGFTGNYILNTSVDDLCDYIEQKYRLEIPVLRVDERVIHDSGEVEVDVSQDWQRAIFDRSQPYYIKGTYLTVAVPFDGDATLFQYRPSTFSTVIPTGKIEGNELHLRYEGPALHPESLSGQIDSDIRQIQQHLQWVGETVAQFNGRIRQIARQRIENRREKLLKDAGLTAALGLPMRQREGVPQTYSAPVTRRKPPIETPPASTTPFEPEPTLALQEYESIISIISNMVKVMERSPKAFSHMGEEALRDHFLVQLNGQYEGQATGETFNYEGKTDILIRANGRNVFIAECKFWKGPEGLQKTIDQLLGYATWRDTKTAIILFNRNKGMSAVLAKIPDVIKSHPNFKREIDYPSETGFRFVIHQRDDKNREMLMTVLVFDVPS